MSLYEILNVSKDASQEEIRKSHRRLARKYHPDVSKEEGAKEKFQVVQGAYDVLSDVERRAHYDETGEENKEDPIVAARGMLAYVMKQVLIATIDAPHVNLVSAIHKHLSTIQDELNQQAGQHKAILAKMKKHLGRVCTKGNTLNIYEAIVESEREQALKMLEHHPVMIERIGLCRTLLKEYECEEQEPEARDFGFNRGLW